MRAHPLGVSRDRRGRHLVYVDIHDEHAGADDRRITGAIHDGAPGRHDPG
jgi:hypothetical protein